MRSRILEGMARYDASSAEVAVFSFKEGLLSAVAHDLKLMARRFTIEAEGERITAQFDAGSLEVVTAMKDGAEHSGSLSDSMKGDIQKNLQRDVLDLKRFPTITFEASSVGATSVEGRLTLHGVTKTVSGRRVDAGGRRIAEFRFDQRDFGIKPFSAMLGTLKIKPEVLVRVSLPQG